MTGALEFLDFPSVLLAAFDLLRTGRTGGIGEYVNGFSGSLLGSGFVNANIRWNFGDWPGSRSRSFLKPKLVVV